MKDLSAEFELAVSDTTVDGELLASSGGSFGDECPAWAAPTCGLTPYNIRDICSDQSYNPTVGRDSVSGSVKVTDTFALAPGLASKNSAVNFLKGTGYDPSNFGMVRFAYA